MLPIENKIVFTDGNIDSPYITRIIEVMSESDTICADVRSIIYDEERGRSSVQTATRLIQDYFGSENIVEYSFRDGRPYGWADRRRKGTNRTSFIKNRRAKQDRRGNVRNDTQDLWDESPSENNKRLNSSIFTI